MKISVEDIRKFKPCYDPCEIKGITETTAMTLAEWLNYKAKKLTDQDKVWLASRFMSETQNRVFAIWCARQCDTKVKEITDYIDVIEKHYIFKTATAEEMRVADRAADSAAARAADGAACWAADRAAYCAADRAADWAVRKKQIEKIKEILGEGEKGDGA